MKARPWLGARDRMAYFTEDEARAYLPRLDGSWLSAEAVGRLGVKAGTNGHATVRTSATADDAPLGIDPEQAEAELEEKGIILRDPVRGLVDFPRSIRRARSSSSAGSLGEEDLGWWHLPEDGFAGRRPLPVPPEI